MALIDTSTPFGERAAHRLETDALAWLVTVGKDGTPRPVPVWFLWDAAAGEVLVYSRADMPKLANAAARPRAALHLDGDGKGGDIVILSGSIAGSDDPPADQVAGYVAKYAWGFERLGMSAEEFGAAYSVPLRLKVERVRGH